MTETTTDYVVETRDQLSAALLCIGGTRGAATITCGGTTYRFPQGLTYDRAGAIAARVRRTLRSAFGGTR